MLPITFPEQNFTFTKPAGWTDEQCSDLSVYKGEYADGTPAIISYWKPSKEDLDILNNGGGIYVNILSINMPPISLDTESPFETKK